jgi:hypothetical protein
MVVCHCRGAGAVVQYRGLSKENLAAPATGDNRSNRNGADQCRARDRQPLANFFCPGVAITAVIVRARWVICAGVRDHLRVASWPMTTELQLHRQDSRKNEQRSKAVSHGLRF